jgi:hypothetical protein
MNEIEEKATENGRRNEIRNEMHGRRNEMAHWRGRRDK